MQDGARGEDGAALAVLRDEPDACRHRCVRRAQAHRLGVHGDFAVGGDRAAERQRELALAAADQARDSDDLARAHLEGRVLHGAVVRRQTLHREHGSPCSSSACEEVGDLASDHHAHERALVASRAAARCRSGGRRAAPSTREQQLYSSRRRCEMNTIATPRSRSSSRRSQQALASQPRRASSSPRRGRSPASRPRPRARPRPPAASRSRASPTRRAGIDVHAERRRAPPWRGGAPPASRSRRGCSAGGPSGCSPRRVSVGASVSSWLIATMPCSIAARGPRR